PAAAIKLVNNLDLIITNLDTGEVYLGKDISPDIGYNEPWDTNTPPRFDTVNNVENILLPPLLGTGTLPLGTNTVWGPNGVVTIGQTNQWHFYIVTNTGPRADYTNAAFITFDAVTLSIPRMGVYETTVGNATRTEADIDLYVTQDSSLTNLS